MRIVPYDHAAKKKLLTSVSLNEDLLAKVQELDIDISAATEDGIAQRVQQEYERRMKCRIDHAMDQRNSFRLYDRNAVPGSCAWLGS